MAVAKEQIRQIISGNNINSVADIYTLLKDSFKDILQELMEAELDATLGYEKNHKGDIHKVANSILGWYRRSGMNVVNFIISKDLLENRIKDGAGLLNPLSYYLAKVGI